MHPEGKKSRDMGAPWHEIFDMSFERNYGETIRKAGSIDEALKFFNLNYFTNKEPDEVIIKTLKEALGKYLSNQELNYEEKARLSKQIDIHKILDEQRSSTV